MNHTLHIVTGAPGAGKSTSLLAFIRLHTPFIAFDIDWLTVSASQLAGKDIIDEPLTWPAYKAVWFELLHAVKRNHHNPVFFTPTDPNDMARDGQPEWCRRIEWLLLDCDDQLRRQRLKQRPEWTDAMIEEAIDDATRLRAMVVTHINTGVEAPESVARQIRDWLERTSTPDADDLMD